MDKADKLTFILNNSFLGKILSYISIIIQLERLKIDFRCIAAYTETNSTQFSSFKTEFAKSSNNFLKNKPSPISKVHAVIDLRNCAK